MIEFDNVESAIADIAAGRPVIVVDDADRENEGDIVFAAASATTRLMAFAVRHSSGMICVPMEAHDLERLQIPMMAYDNIDSMGTAFTVSVDAAAGVTTGISAADRARTARVLADPASVVADLRRPGHVHALRSRPGGVLTRRGHTEAAVDLVKLAGLAPVGVLGELINDDGTMKRGAELRDFADVHGLRIVSIESLVRYRRRHEAVVQRGAVTRLPTSYGMLTAVGYFDRVDGADHIAVIAGDVGGREAVPTWIHSECVVGDVFGSSACSCSAALTAALETVAQEGLGVVIYVRRTHGTYGSGGAFVPRSPEVILQDECETRTDRARTVEAAALMLRDLGVVSVRPIGGDTELSAMLRGEDVDVVEGQDGGAPGARRGRSPVLAPHG
ncbi:3,4-dihydroxy-2-butanone-4-phosphate synthase [Nocardia sp. NPDC050378]|uniref:3,4-dihydroxy-2-butanone-4-phosphate synthase n=1 Tax=Nocardia sp. NPDC050378 TaxID=3155400 RepID=UPI0033F5CAAE